VRNKRKRTQKRLCLKARRDEKAKLTKEQEDAEAVGKMKWRDVKKKHPGEEIITRKEFEFIS
jgi:hypothetical protein